MDALLQCKVLWPTRYILRWPYGNRLKRLPETIARNDLTVIEGAGSKLADFSFLCALRPRALTIHHRDAHKSGGLVIYGGLSCDDGPAKLTHRGARGFTMQGSRGPHAADLFDVKQCDVHPKPFLRFQRLWSSTRCVMKTDSLLRCKGL